MYCKWHLRMQQSETRSYHASSCYEKVKFPSVISGFVYLNRQVKISLSILRVSVSGWAQDIPGCLPPMIPDIFPIESQHREMLHFFLSVFGFILSILVIASSKHFTALSGRWVLAVALRCYVIYILTPSWRDLYAMIIPMLQIRKGFTLRWIV